MQTIPYCNNFNVICTLVNHLNLAKCEMNCWQLKPHDSIEHGLWLTASESSYGMLLNRHTFTFTFIVIQYWFYCECLISHPTDTSDTIGRRVLPCWTHQTFLPRRRCRSTGNSSKPSAHVVDFQVPGAVPRSACSKVRPTWDHNPGFCMLMVVCYEIVVICTLFNDLIIFY